MSKTMEARSVNFFSQFTMVDVVYEIEHLEAVAFNKKVSPLNRTRANQELAVLQNMLKYFEAAMEEDIDLDDVTFYELMAAVVGEDKLNSMLEPSIANSMKGVMNKAKDVTVNKGRGVASSIGDLFYILGGKK